MLSPCLVSLLCGFFYCYFLSSSSPSTGSTLSCLRASLCISWPEGSSLILHLCIPYLPFVSQLMHWFQKISRPFLLSQLPPVPLLGALPPTTIITIALLLFTTYRHVIANVSLLFLCSLRCLYMSFNFVNICILALLLIHGLIITK